MLLVEDRSSCDGSGRGERHGVYGCQKELRQRMLKVRAQIPEGSRLEQSLAAGRIAEREVLSPLRARRGRKLNLFCYVAFRDEPDTWPLLANGLAQGDRLLTPRIGPERSLSLHEISGTEDLVPGTWGIREPAGHTAVWPPERYPEIDVIVVPGLAFDRNGGGSDLEQGITIA